MFCQGKHVGPPTPIFLSFQFIVSCRSNTSLVRSSILVCICWLSWRGVGQSHDDTVKDKNRRKTEWKEDKRRNTHIYRHNTEETSETGWDEIKLECCCWARNQQHYISQWNRNKGASEMTQRQVIADQSVPSPSSVHCGLHTGTNTFQSGYRTVVWYCQTGIFSSKVRELLPLWAHLSDGFLLSILLVYAVGPYMCVCVFLVPETERTG